MSKLTGFLGTILEKQKACMAACLIVSLVSGSICAATAFDTPGLGDTELPVSMANVSQVQAAEPTSIEPVDDGSIPDDDCMYVFYSAWEGYEFKPSEINSEYDVGDEIKITINYNRSVGSQIASNVGGTWTTFPADGKTLEATFIPDDDWLNLQITDLKEASSVGVVSIDIEITLKNAAKLARMRYTSKGDHKLFSGGFEEAYETDDLWLSYCDDTDWLTLTYDCGTPGQEGWGILGWGGSLNGNWINGPGYGADKKDSTAEVTVNFTVKYLRRMMHLSKSDELDFTSLGAWGGGRIKSLVLHRGSLMPRSDILFENGAVNEEWVCKDIEQLLDENGARFICLKYTCANEENYGWSVLGFGAGVDGEWKSGRSFKVSEYQPDRVHYDFMTMDQFRASMGLSWDVKVDSISLGAYNEGQILKLWLSDTPALDPGDDVEFEDEWESPNAAVYKRVAYADGTVYPQNISLPKAWAQEHPAGEKEIIESLGKHTYIVVSYHSEGSEVPTLYISMKDNKQSHVKAVWSDGKKAVYSYDCIAKMFPGYLIPQEMDSLAISTAEKPMTISEIKTVTDRTKLEEEPIAVLTDDWSGFETQISKYHAGYQPGDTVRVTVTFDKKAPGGVAFHLNGAWKAGELKNRREFTVTATPDDDYMSIQIGEIPRTKSCVIIEDIRVEIIGKTNYTTAVVERGEKEALLADGAMETAKASGLTDAEIGNGKQLVVTTTSSSLSGTERTKVQALLDTYALEESGYGMADCVDITLAMVLNGTETPVHETPQKLRFKVAAPSSVDGSTHDFGVIRLHGESADLLPDVDDEDATITFESDCFSKYVVVYGPKDCFKELRGDTSIHTFVKTWNSWDLKLNDYIEGNAGFGAGDTVKITVEFNKNTSSEINTNVNGTWTKLGSSENSNILTVTGKPDGDTVALQIADLLGEKSVKVMSVKVEITESAPLPVFTEPGDKDITLNKFLKDFAAGTDKVKITVNLSSDGAFKGNLMGNSIDKTGTGWHEANGKNPFESEENKSTFTWITIPQYGNLTVRISEMAGTQVKIDSVTVERTEEEDTVALPVFKKTGEKSLNLKSFLTDLVPGTDYVKVTVKLSSDGTFEGNLEGSVVQNNKEEWGKANTESDYISDRSDTYVWCLTPVYDSITLKINKMSGSEVKVDSVTVERTIREPEPEPEVPEDVLMTFASSWGGEGGTYETTYSAHMPKGTTFLAGAETTMVLVFDQEVAAKFTGEGIPSGDEFQLADPVESGGKYTVTKTVNPTEDKISIQIGNMPHGVTSVNLLSMEVTQKTASEQAPLFILGAGDSRMITLSEYNKDYKPGDKAEVTVYMKSSDYFNGSLGGNAKENGDSWQSAGVESDSNYESRTVWTGTLTGDDGQLKLETWTVNSGEVKVMDITVKILEKGQEPSDALLIFTSSWQGSEALKFTDFLESFVPGLETTVTLTFDQEMDQGKIVFKDYEGNDDWSGGYIGEKGTTLMKTVIPYGDSLVIQSGNVAEGQSVKLIDIKVEQSRTAVKNFTKEWGADDSQIVGDNLLQGYMEDPDAFQTGAETTVILVFDKAVQTKTTYHKDNANEDIYAEEASQLHVIKGMVPSSAYMCVQISNMNGNDSADLLSIRVIQTPEEAGTSAMPDEESGVSEETPTEPLESSEEAPAEPLESSEEPLAESLESSGEAPAEEDVSNESPSDEGEESLPVQEKSKDSSEEVENETETL